MYYFEFQNNNTTNTNNIASFFTKEKFAGTSLYNQHTPITQITQNNQNNGQINETKQNNQINNYQQRTLTATPLTKLNSTFQSNNPQKSTLTHHSTNHSNQINNPSQPHSSQFSAEDNLHVVIRVRPPLPRECPKDLPFRSIVLTNTSFNNCSLVEYLGIEIEERERQKEWIESSTQFQIHRFSFDHVFDMDATQLEVYEKTAKPAVNSILEGYNSTIFAYGQTGTGKTFTMEGFTYNSSDETRGIIPRCIENIFDFIESFTQSDTKFMVRASYLQIYNESVSDLLKTERNNLNIREDKKKGVYVEVSTYNNTFIY